MMPDSFWLVWCSIGLMSHIFWWHKLSKGEWDGIAIPMCLLTAIQATLLGPATFIVEGILYWLLEA